MYSVSHSTENWRVFNARRPMRIKATTTGLQAAERDRGREKEGSREEATHCRAKKEKKKKNLIVLLLAPLAGTYWNRLPYLTLYNSATFSPSRPTEDQNKKKKKTKKRSWSKGVACLCLCVYLAPVGSVTHTLSTMHTCELKSSVMSQTLSLCWVQ